MSVSTFSHLSGARHPPASFNDAPLSQSFSSAYSCRRPRIRTNPWIQTRSTSTHHHPPPSSASASIFRSPQPVLASRSIYSAPDALSASAKGPHHSTVGLKPPELLYSSMDRTAQLRVKSLDESTCSSGYGSQDSRFVVSMFSYSSLPFSRCFCVISNLIFAFNFLADFKRLCVFA